MILTLKILYAIIGLWFAFNAAVRGSVPLTDTIINDKYLSILSIIFSGVFWIFLPILPLSEGIFRYFKSFKN